MAYEGPRRRRTVLRLCAVAAAGTAGCATDESGGGSEGTDGPGRDGGADENDTETSGEAPTTATATEAATETADGETATDLDLREANVTDVEIERSDGSYRFSVTLYHDDDGEEGYADWWQVESLDGDQLGRRDLAHPHSTDPFTRSETVEVPDDIDCVVVRGHDQTHEYGGRAMLVTLGGSATRGMEQGPDPDSFSEADCP